MTFNIQIKHILIIGILGIVLLPGLSQADLEDIGKSTLQSKTKVDLGYRGSSVHGEPARAAEYRSLRSSPTLDLDFFIPFESFYLDMEGSFLSDDEYNVDAELNAKAQVRLHLRSERMFHNLDHIPYDNGLAGAKGSRVPSTAVEGSRPDSDADVVQNSEDFGRKIYYTDHNTNDTYGLRIDLNEVKARIKAPGYPAHFNLAYWRYEKQGEKQLRFVNHPERDGRACTGCHLQSKTRSVDRITEEVKASVDAHVGFFDMVVETLYRSFRDREQTPEDNFSNLGQLPHDEDPDSTLRETTLSVNTNQSGGLAGSASVTVGKRENESDLTSEGPIKADIDYIKTTADVSYIPNAQWTFNLRYRHLDMDRDNPSELTTYAGADTGIPVRQAIDTNRDWYEAIVNYRPMRTLTLKAELHREDIGRDFSDSETWDIPKNEAITSAKVGFYSRLLEKSALKINGWAAYRHSDDPAYGTSAEDRKEVFLAAQYTPKSHWGLSASANLLDEENDGRHVNQDGVIGYADSIPVPPGSTPVPGIINFDIDRERQQQTAIIGGWLTPRDGVTVDLNYGFFRTAIEQDLLFGNSPDTADPERNFTLEDEGVDLRQTVHTVRAGVTWHASNSINCRFEGHHIRTKEHFSADFYRDGLMYGKGPTFGGGTTAGIPGEMSSEDLREINKVDIVQNGIRGRVNWQIDDNWSCSVEAAFDDYDERNSDEFDGSVQSTMVSFTRQW